MKATILVVDDTPTNLQILVRLLSDSGYRILVAEDGPGALEQLARVMPDLILLDVSMPVMDGFETCRRIKEQPEFHEIPILFLTARAGLSDKLKGFAAGAVDYITKPIQKEEVIARVHTHLTLVEQKQQLQQMLEQRQRFMRIAAHDLRNLLAVISGYSSLCLKSPELQEKLRAFDRIHRASQNMKAIIDDFLALQTLARDGDDRSETFELQQVVAQVFDQAAFFAQSKSIGLSQELPPGSLKVLGNVGHTHQILTNYISNALKYSPPHTQTCVSIRPLGPVWRIEVRDQGPGVQPEERDRLFVEFARISNKPTGSETSTRLGLSIVKALATAQGGRVGAEFPETGGSIFWLEVSVYEPDTTKPAVTEPSPGLAQDQ